MSRAVPERRAPAPIADLMAAFVRAKEPVTPLAVIQRVWPEVVGPVIAKESTPERYAAGTVTVRCSSTLWANELELMQLDIVAKLDDRVQDATIAKLRCTSVEARRRPERARPERRSRPDRDRWKPR